MDEKRLEQDQEGSAKCAMSTRIHQQGRGSHTSPQEIGPEYGVWEVWTTKAFPPSTTAQVRGAHATLEGTTQRGPPKNNTPASTSISLGSRVEC